MAGQVTTTVIPAVQAPVGDVIAVDNDLATVQRPVDDNDTDSAINTIATGSSTTSVASSILRYREENGRRYHALKDGSYVIPNDDDEQARLDLQHHMFLITQNGRLHQTPLPDQVHNVLDVGTGTGIWAIDFADEHPEARVIGVDLSPIQPSFVPPNVVFQVDDLEEPWTFGNKFDFIYARMMTGSFKNYPQYFSRAFDALEDGGWMEAADILPITSDDSTSNGTDLQRWSDLVVEGSAKIGRSFNSAAKYQELMEAEGFINVTRHVYKWPMNQWPRDAKLKELSLYTLENFSSGAYGLSVAVFTRVLGWTTEELEIFLAKVRKDMKDTAIHAYWPIYVIYGQKPKKSVN